MSVFVLGSLNVDMGITKGVVVEIKKVAPFGDPVSIKLRGYELAIRRADMVIEMIIKGTRRAMLKRSFVKVFRSALARSFRREAYVSSRSGTAAYPAAAMALEIALSSADPEKVTIIELVSKETSASVTPGTFSAAFCTWSTRPSSKS